MKRGLILLLFFLATPLFAFRELPPPGARIAVLRISSAFTYPADRTVAATIQSDLCSELRRRGFDAFDARVAFEDLAHGQHPDADFYVEVVSGNAANQPVAGGGIGTESVGVDLAVVIARVAAEVRLYDKDLRIIGQYDLHRDSTAVLPTGIGLGGRHLWAWIPLPLVQYAQSRYAAHAVAAQAAARIAGQ